MKREFIKTTALLCVAVQLITMAGCSGAGSSSNSSTQSAASQTRSVTMDKYSNPRRAEADPYVYTYDGWYYYAYPDTDNKIYLSKSQSLLYIGERQLVYEFPPGEWNSHMNWGPAAIFRWDDGNWYIIYCAADGYDITLNNINHRLGVLRSTTGDPFGPYEDLSAEKPLDTGDIWSINAQPFQDFEGNWYLTWSGVEKVKGQDYVFFPQNTYIARMKNPWTLGKRVMISSPELPWECSVEAIQEGQTVVRRNNKLIMFYSANASWTDDYCLGMLTYSGGDILNPDSWVKYPEPVLKKSEAVKGPGAAAITKSPDGTEDWIIFHAAQQSGSGWTRYENMLKFTWSEDDVPIFGTLERYGTMMPIPSGDSIRETEHYEATWETIGGDAFNWTPFGGDWYMDGAGKDKTFGLTGAVLVSKSINQTVAHIDLSYECTMGFTNRPDKMADAGILFRVTGPSIGMNAFSGYYAALDYKTQKIKLTRGNGKMQAVLAEAPADIKTLTDYHLRVEAVGAEIKVYLDGVEKLSVTDNTYAWGHIGVQAYNLAAYFRNLSSKKL